VKLITYRHIVSKLKMRGAIPPLPQHVFTAWCSVKHKENFTLTVMNLFLEVLKIYLHRIRKNMPVVTDENHDKLCFGRDSKCIPPASVNLLGGYVELKHFIRCFHVSDMLTM
jgi:hypothetical protein